MPRPLLRPEQFRRFEPIDSSPQDDAPYVKGRYFQADCPALDLVGHFVYVTGAAVSGVPQVARVDIKVSGKYPAVGLIAEKSSATRCVVMVFGEVPVSPPTLTSGKHYWIGTDGMATDVVPLPGAGERVARQMIGYAIDAGRLLISPDRMLVVATG